MSNRDRGDYGFLNTQVPKYCKPHGEELPCAKCATVRRIRERDARLLHEHERLPLRHPKILETK